MYVKYIFQFTRAYALLCNCLFCVYFIFAVCDLSFTTRHLFNATAALIIACTSPILAEDSAVENLFAFSHPQLVYVSVA